VPDLKTFGEVLNRGVSVPFRTFDGEQGLVLLRGEARVLGGVFAEAEKAAQGVSEIGEHFVLTFGDAHGTILSRVRAAGPARLDLIYIVLRYIISSRR
jgi:hypothetical protein